MGEVGALSGGHWGWQLSTAWKVSACTFEGDHQYLQRRMHTVQYQRTQDASTNLLHAASCMIAEHLLWGQRQWGWFQR